MKKLIGLLGAAGLLLPSAAMAGSIGNTVGTDASRVSSASEASATVTVNSNIYRDNDMHVSGTTSGSDLNISAEEYINGGVGFHYGQYDLSGQTAADIDVDLRADANFHVNRTSTNYDNYDDTTDTYEAQAYVPGGRSCHWWHCTHTDPTPAEPHSVHEYGNGYNEHTGSADGTFGGGALGTYSGITTVDSQGRLERGQGGGHYISGSFAESNDYYTGTYNGMVRENGNTHTGIVSRTDTVSTSNGFESGSFNTTTWN